MKKYTFGNPIELDSIIENVPQAEGDCGFEISQRDDFTVFSRDLDPRAYVYGLGETTRGINKRGSRWINYNTDNPRHKEDTLSLYGSHNFLVVSGEKHMGYFWDTPSRVIYEIDYEGSGKLVVSCEYGDLNLYVIEGESAKDVVLQFRRAIGRSYIPPMWAFGYGQSRWGYKTENDIRKVVTKHQKAGVPLDWVCLDIDYMDRFIDFTVDLTRFPDLAGFAAELKEEGVHMVPIIDAGVKVETYTPAYEEGVKNDYFCKDIDGRDFQAEVWPGMTHFPDFFQPQVRKWFGDKYSFLTDKGIDGFWNDMNEPSIFSSQYNPKTGKKTGRLEGEDGDFQPGRICDYKNFTHQINGETVVHHKVHNAFGYLMTRAASEQLENNLDHRFLLFSRSSLVGAHRYGGIWTGDNTANWDNLRYSLCQMPSLNMTGFLYTGSDIGGFMMNTNRELLLRWLAFGVFTPLMRNHCAKFFRPQEFYRFRGTEDFVSIISLRYRLLPYIYSEYMKAALRGGLYFAPLAFEYPEDEIACKVEDQLMVGESMMIAPVIAKTKTRSVYLPEAMTRVRYDGKGFTCSPAEKGVQQIEVALNEVVFYIRSNCLVPVAETAQTTKDVDFENLTLLGDGETYELYLDDGISRDYSLEDHIRKLSR